jgi:hypothetical protein
MSDPDSLLVWVSSHRWGSSHRPIMPQKTASRHQACLVTETAQMQISNSGAPLLGIAITRVTAPIVRALASRRGMTTERDSGHETLTTPIAEYLAGQESVLWTDERCSDHPVTGRLTSRLVQISVAACHVAGADLHAGVLSCSRWAD